MRNKWINILLLVFLTGMAFTASPQPSLYVSPNGTGSAYSKENPGHVNGLTAKIAELRKSVPGKINVFFEGGIYFLEKPLNLTNRETGNGKDTLILESIGENRVILSGGQRIEHWEKAGKGIWKAKIPKGIYFRQLYVNGKMAVRARTPNRENENDFGPYFRNLGFDPKNKTVKVRSSEIADWKNLNEVEMVVHQHWYQSRIKIESFRKEKDTAFIVPMQPARDHLFRLTYARMLADGKPYYFENALEFLDQEGEWYLDKNNNTVYYKPVGREDIQQLNVIYPVLETVVSVSGRAEKPVCNLILKNLQVAYSNWTLPGRDGIIATQAVQGRGYSGDTETGIIQVAFARNVSIENCEFVGSGNHGVVFSRGVQNSRIQLCHFDQISANGIVIDTDKKSFPPDSLFCKNNRISYNLIENVGMHYTNGMGLIASCVAGLRVENNEIRFGRYSGMQIGNHFGDNLSGMRDNLILRNNIHHVMQLHDDGGAIYTLALQPGTKIMENWMHDFGKSIWADDFPVNGVFLDNNSGYIRVQDNVFTDLTTVDRIKEQCAGNATTRDNILVNNNTQSQEVKNQSGVRGKAGMAQR